MYKGRATTEMFASIPIAPRSMCVFRASVGRACVCRPLALFSSLPLFSMSLSSFFFPLSKRSSVSAACKATAGSTTPTGRDFSDRFPQPCEFSEFHFPRFLVPPKEICIGKRHEKREARIGDVCGRRDTLFFFLFCSQKRKGENDRVIALFFSLSEVWPDETQCGASTVLSRSPTRQTPRRQHRKKKQERRHMAIVERKKNVRVPSRPQKEGAEKKKGGKRIRSDFLQRATSSFGLCFPHGRNARIVDKSASAPYARARQRVSLFQFHGGGGGQRRAEGSWCVQDTRSNAVTVCRFDSDFCGPSFSLAQKRKKEKEKKGCK